MPTDNPSDRFIVRKKNPDAGNKTGLHVWNT
jgi:hypothetical protein